MSVKQISDLFFDNKFVAGGSGCISSLTAYFIQIDFTGWAMHTTMKVVEVAIVGFVGGAMGLMGKMIIEKLFSKKIKS